MEVESKQYSTLYKEYVTRTTWDYYNLLMFPCQWKPSDLLTIVAEVVSYRKIIVEERLIIDNTITSKFIN